MNGQKYAGHGLPQDRPLTLADFAQLKKGHVLTLHYDCANQGSLQWIHSHVEGGRVHGAFEDGDEVSGYLYVSNGYVCKGSGAEPVWAVVPVWAGRG